MYNREKGKKERQRKPKIKVAKLKKKVLKMNENWGAGMCTERLSLLIMYPIFSVALTCPRLCLLPLSRVPLQLKSSLK